MKEQENRLKLNIQLFAEEGETTPTSDDTSVAEKEPQKPLTFDEMLKSENYQSEFDRRVAKSLDTAKAKWLKEYEAQKEAEKTEAQKLAKMDAEQKLTYEKEKAEKERNEFEAKLNAYELKDTALSLAKEKTVDVSLLDLIDFSKETAESVNKKLDLIKTNFDKAVEKAVNERLKQDTPKQYNNTSSKEEDPYIKGFLQAFK